MKTHPQKGRKMKTLSIDYKKLKHLEVKKIIAHNKRENNNVESQLDKKHWFDEMPIVSFVELDIEKLNKANSLSKRKDAIELVSFVIQIGNQTDWREEPTPDFPLGKPKSIDKNEFKKLANELINALKKEYGEENLVGCELHLDESSPHFHIYLTPIKDNKLQAKSFINGKGDLIAIRKDISNAVNKITPCAFKENSEIGGEKHDSSLSAKAKSSALSLIGLNPKDKKIAELEKELINKDLLIERQKQALRQQQKTRFKKASSVQVKEAEARAKSEREMTTQISQKLSAEREVRERLVSEAVRDAKAEAREQVNRAEKQAKESREAAEKASKALLEATSSQAIPKLESRVKALETALKAEKEKSALFYSENLELGEKLRAQNRL